MYWSQNAVGGTSGTDLEYAIGPIFGYSNVYLFDGVVYKSAYAYSINPLTQESAVFGNDWTLSFISKTIDSMLRVVSFPMFSAIIECSTGHVIASSSDTPIFSGENLLKIQEINDVFFKDFSQVVNSTFTWEGKNRPINDITSQLFEVYAFIDEYFPGAQAAYVDRTVNGDTWKLALNTYNLIGNKMLFVTYMNVDLVEAELNKTSAKTGYMMIGIILAFMVLGAGFTVILKRQIHVVSNQIRLLKNLKFKEVLGADAKLKNVSFIYELAELQTSFHRMVLVFSDHLKKNASTPSSARPTSARTEETHTGKLPSARPWVSRGSLK
ncbi:UNVERIFIED_CONTAM: hypothetical protein HDU68_001184 [Siphonaria sp. JEL0065]|nr:hypothetical protein HDU68_001184 [Siphonaria sp. JEL0065]